MNPVKLINFSVKYTDEHLYAMNWKVNKPELNLVYMQERGGCSTETVDNLDARLTSPLGRRFSTLKPQTGRRWTPEEIQAIMAPIAALLEAKKHAAV